jgi:hypothetical protein
MTQVPRVWPISVTFRHLKSKHPNLKFALFETAKIKSAKHRESDGAEKEVNVPPRSMSDYPNEISWMWSKYVMGSGEINLLHLEISK